MHWLAKICLESVAGIAERGLIRSCSCEISDALRTLGLGAAVTADCDLAFGGRPRRLGIFGAVNPVDVATGSATSCGGRAESMPGSSHVTGCFKAPSEVRFFDGVA